MSPAWRARAAVLAALLPATAACGGGPAPPDAGAPLAPPRLWVSSSDYQSGALAAVAMGSLRAATDLAPLTGDAVLGWHGATLVALNFDAAGQDNATYLDVGSWPPRVLRQVALRPAAGSGHANPRSYLAVDARRGYVALTDAASVAVVDAERGVVLDRVDLAAFGAGDHAAYPFRLARVGAEAWVLVQRLPPGRADPTAPGVIAVIDPAGDRLVDLDPAVPGAQGIELRHPNPVGQPIVRGGGATVWVTCVGSYDRVGDGAVEEIDAAARRSRRDLLTEAELGGNLDAAVALDDDRLLVRVVVGTARAVTETRLVEWSVAQRRAVRVWLSVARYQLTEPVAARDGRVYVGDRGDEAAGRPAGVRVFDAATGAEVTPTPIPVGLPPYDLAEEPVP